MWQVACLIPPSCHQWWWHAQPQPHRDLFNSPSLLYIVLIGLTLAETKPLLRILETAPLTWSDTIFYLPVCFCSLYKCLQGWRGFFCTVFMLQLAALCIYKPLLFIPKRLAVFYTRLSKFNKNIEQAKGKTHSEKYLPKKRHNSTTPCMWISSIT